MRIAMRVMVISLAVCALGAAQAMAASPVRPLDGTRWKIRIAPDEAARRAGEKPSNDTLVFKNGEMTSTACVKHGFKASPYTASQSGSSWSFTSEQVSAKQGKTAWAGTVNGKAVNGTMAWTKPDGTILRAAFAGTEARRAKFPRWFSLHPGAAPRVQPAVR